MRKALALALLLAVPLWADTPVAVVTQVQGEVRFDGKAVHRLTRLIPGKPLRLAKGAQLELAFFADGSRLTVKVDRQTEARVTDKDVLGLPGKRQPPRALAPGAAQFVNASMGAMVERKPLVESDGHFTLLSCGSFREGVIPLAWTPDERAQTYTVRVDDGTNPGTVWEQKGLTATNCTTPRLPPGDYRVFVLGENPEWGQKTKPDSSSAYLQVLQPQVLKRLEVLEKQAAANPDDLALQFFLAVDYQELGLRQDALRMADRLSQAFPDDPGVRDYCAAVRQ